MRPDQAPEGGKFRAIAAAALDATAGVWGELDMMCVDFDSSGNLIAASAGGGVGVIWTKEGRKPLDDDSENEIIGGRKYTVFTFAEFVEAENGTSPALSAGDTLYCTGSGDVSTTGAIGDLYVGQVVAGGSRLVVNFNGSATA